MVLPIKLPLELVDLPPCSFAVANEVVRSFLCRAVTNDDESGSTTSSASQDDESNTTAEWYTDLSSIDISKISRMIYNEDDVEPQSDVNDLAIQKNSTNSTLNLHFLDLDSKENSDVALNALVEFLSILIEKYFAILEHNFVERDYLLLYCCMAFHGIFDYVAAIQRKKSTKSSGKLFSKLLLKSLRVFDGHFYRFCKTLKKKNQQFNNFVMENSNFSKIMYLWLKFIQNIQLLARKVCSYSFCFLYLIF
jgi:hypothetical protein